MAKRKQAHVQRRDTSSLPPSSEDESSDPRKRVRWNTSVDESLESPSIDVSEELARTPMAICCLHGRLGCAYYDPIKRVIFVLEDTQESQHFDLTKMLLEQVTPDVLLTSSRSDEEFIDLLQARCEASGSEFYIRPYKEFLPTKGKDRLTSLNLLSELTTTDPHDQSSDIASEQQRPQDAYSFMQQRKEVNGDPLMKRWNASIRLSNFATGNPSPQCMGSIGAVIEHLVRDSAMNELEDEGIRGLEVRDIEALALNQVMHINSDALLSLQIFEAECHASIHSDKTKEGLSLFGILNTTKTTLGKALLRTWFLRPTLDLSVIIDRHNALECFVNPMNATSISSLNGHLKGIKNVPSTLSFLRTGKAKLRDWQAMVHFTFHATMLRDAICELHQAKDILIVRKLLEVLDVSAFSEVGTKINDIIDWEESSIAERVCVRRHVDEELDNRKHTYHGIDAVLSKVAEQICETIPPRYATNLNVVYFPQLGFLTCIPMLEEWSGEGDIHPLDGWTFQFSSESHVYFKSQEMQDMDMHIGDLHSAVVDREIEIIQDLLIQVMQEDKAMSRVCDICAELDCLLSLADACRMYKYIRPTMVNGDAIRIVQGRHPLHELMVDSFVPNDATLAVPGELDENMSVDEEEPAASKRVLICTGANACGKSVYLKQIALIQFMAQIGCFVPAESAVLGIVDKIFTRVATRESVSTVQSAFMIDLNQVSLAVRNATRRSLLLIDEFGKGTLPTDGAGTFCGLVQHFLSRGEDCPKVIAATHFHDVFRDDLLDINSNAIVFSHMQVMFSSENDERFQNSDKESGGMGTTSSHGKESITYLYRVAEGLSLDSHAAHCAEIFGVPARIVERAQYVSMLLSAHELGKLIDEALTEEEKQELQDAEEICRRFLSWDLSDIAEDGKARLGKILGADDEGISGD